MNLQGVPPFILLRWICLMQRLKCYIAYCRKTIQHQRVKLRGSNLVQEIILITRQQRLQTNT